MDSVKSLLVSAPSFHHLAPTEQSSLEHHMVKIAGYAAECLRDDWVQSEKLGQRPVAVTRPATALSAADEFEPAAADQIARVTRATLEAISFPDFVSDLIRGSFNAIVDSSIQQMEAYTRLLEDVSKTVDQFMADNITDNQARDWLAQRYPLQIALAPGEPRLTARDGAEDSPAPGWREELGLPEAVDPGDEDAYEEILVPAARRKLAQSRLQTLSMLVLMGINRVIVTGGKIRATMALHVDTTDRSAQQRASDFDFRTSAAGSVGFGPWSASASMSVGYVKSTRTQSESELNVDADLTGEVEIHFKSDVFPLERFVNEGGAETIRRNTPVPESNPPPWGESASMRAGRTERPPAQPVRPIGQMPPAPAPPTPPAPVTPPAPRAGGGTATPSAPPAGATPPPGASPSRPGAGSGGRPVTPPPARSPAPGGTGTGSETNTAPAGSDSSSTTTPGTNAGSPPRTGAGAPPTAEGSTTEEHQL